MSNEQKSRFAELASEMLGAKMAAEFVREAWASASPEAKREMADALVARVSATLKNTSDWSLNQCINEIVKSLADEKKDTVADALRPVVDEAVNAKIATAKDLVSRVVAENFATHALETIASSCARRLSR